MCLSEICVGVYMCVWGGYVCASVNLTTGAIIYVVVAFVC